MVPRLHLVEKMGIPKTIGFNTFQWSNDLDHVKAPLWLWKLHLSKETCKKTSQVFCYLLKSHDQTFAGKAGQNMFFKHTLHSTNTSDNNNVLLVKIEGLFWNTIYIYNYHHLPVVKGVNKPFYILINQPMGHLCLTNGSGSNLPPLIRQIIDQHQHGKRLLPML